MSTLDKKASVSSRCRPPLHAWLPALMATAIILEPTSAIAAESSSTIQSPTRVTHVVPAPAWVKEIPPGTWQAVSLNTPADIDPAKDPSANGAYPGPAPWRANMGQAAVINNWNGGAFATRYGEKGSYILYGGGHGGYYGNEIYAFDMATRMWARVTNPYPSVDRYLAGERIVMNDLEAYPEGLYPDGTPTPRHTYDSVCYRPTTNELVVTGAQKNNWGGHIVPRVFQFSFDTKTWRKSRINTKNHANAGAWSTWDSKRDVVWVEGGPSAPPFTKFEPDVDNGDGTFGRFTNYAYKLSHMDAVAAYNPLHDLIVVASFRLNGNGSGRYPAPVVIAVDPRNPSDAGVKLTQIGAPPSPIEGAAGWEWSETHNAILYWRRNSQVYKLSPGPDPLTDPWTWSLLSDPSSTTGPSPMTNDNGIYSRFQIAHCSDAEVALVINRNTDAVFAFRVPELQNVRVPSAPTSLSAR